MPLERPSGLESDSSQKPLELSNEQMFKFIRVSMVRLEEEVSGMVEILEVLQQELIKDSPREII